MAFERGGGGEKVVAVDDRLHDVGKPYGSPHSEIGAGIAERLCPRLGLSAEETETVAWLVLHHLDMSDTAFKRDLEDPETIRGFADRVQSLERLRLLLVLTVADIRAVGPGTWTPWKAALLRDLYWSTEEVLSGGLLTEGRQARIKAAQKALRAELADWSEREFKARVQVLIATYNHRVNVEWLTLRNLAIDSVLPAAVGYQQRVAASIAAVQQVSKSIDLAPQLKLLEEITGLTNKLKLAADRLTEVGTKAESNHGREGAAFYRDEVVPAMAELRLGQEA